MGGKSSHSKQRARLRAIALLGGKCVHCGIDDPIVLNIDHIEDDGAIERKTLDPTQICARLAQGKLSTERYQLLCCNCNWRKEYFRRRGSLVMAPPAPRLNQNDGKPTCINGHPFDEVNTYLRTDRPGHRMCRLCNREAQYRYAEQKRQAS